MRGRQPRAGRAQSDRYRCGTRRHWRLPAAGWRPAAASTSARCGAWGDQTRPSRRLPDHQLARGDHGGPIPRAWRSLQRAVCRRGAFAGRRHTAPPAPAGSSPAPPARPPLLQQKNRLESQTTVPPRAHPFSANGIRRSAPPAVAAPATRKTRHLREPWRLQRALAAPPRGGLPRGRLPSIRWPEAPGKRRHRTGPPTAGCVSRFLFQGPRPTRGPLSSILLHPASDRRSEKDRIRS